MQLCRAIINNSVVHVTYTLSHKVHSTDSHLEDEGTRNDRAARLVDRSRGLVAESMLCGTNRRAEAAASAAARNAHGKGGLRQIGTAAITAAAERRPSQSQNAEWLRHGKSTNTFGV